MNILEQEDIIKGLPDQALMKEASAPSGEVPQFLVISEIKRRGDMRKRYENQQQQNQGTVKDQILSEAMGGIASMMPPQMAPQQAAMAPMGAPPMGGMPPQGMPPMAPPQTPKPPMPQGGMPPMGGMPSIPQGMPPMGMAQGGIVQMQGGGFLDSYVPQAQLGPVQGGGTVKDQIDRLIDGKMMSAADILAFSQEAFYGQPEAINYVISRLRGAREGMEPKELIRALVGGTTGMHAARLPQAAPQPELEFVYPQEGPQAIRESAQRGVQMLADEVDQNVRQRSFEAVPEFSKLYQEMGLNPAQASNVALGIGPLGPASPFGAPDPAADYSSPKPGTKSADPIAGILEPAASALAQQVVNEYAMPDTGIRGIFASSASDDLGIASVGGGDARVQAANSAEVQSGPALTARQRVQEQRGGDPLFTDFSLGTGRGTRRGLRELEQQAPEGRPRISRDDIPNILTDYTDYAGLLPAVAGDEVAAQSPYTLEYLQQLNATQSGIDAAKKDRNMFAGETIDRSRQFGPGTGTETSDVKGKSTRETKLIDEVASRPGNDRSAPEMPALDFSDLIAEGKQQALANAMIQLGAGVASGDVAKGLSAAGTAAMKGTADARALDMRSRLAEYQAGREDIRRGEEADRFERKMDVDESQFGKQLKQLERKIDATIDVSDATSQRAMLRALSEQVASLREDSFEMTDSEKARFKALEDLLYQTMGLDMSAPAVTSGLSGKDLSGLTSLLN